MSWLGKVIGGAIGYALGGSLGAIAGVVFGHSLDDNTAVPAQASKPILSKNEETQMVFFVAVFSMLAKIAKADGKICEHEYSMLGKFIKKDLHLNSESRDIAMNIFKTAADSDESFDNFAKQFYDHFSSQPGFIDFVLDVLLRVSTSDGVFSPEEEALILRAVHIFDCPTESYLKMKSKYIEKGVDYHGILGCSPQDSDEFVKKQYRKLVNDYHPDKIASKGLPDEFIVFANAKFREIQDAYEKVKHERGIA